MTQQSSGFTSRDDSEQELCSVFSSLTAKIYWSFSSVFISKSPKPDTQKDKGKKPRVWELGNSNAKVLDYSNSTTNGNTDTCPMEEYDPEMVRSPVTRHPDGSVSCLCIVLQSYFKIPCSQIFKGLPG